METEEFRRQLDAPGVLSETLRTYTNTSLSEAEQEVACARLHSLAERLSRFLLTTRDRAGTDHFPLTQEFMSGMLGVHRPTVTVAAKALAAAGFIRYRRGRLSIVDGPALEGSACECYRAITTAVARVAAEPRAEAS
jgi:CRP-like cAMP-binding protein